ncbi:hypothetical protein GF386_02970 [Candidatus Pacearchaeota archaeon]|nr:hypothetical protein [Candidatus Pacearchaeota archaeon]MBD3283101.1 hypothetical protein [Candidatus Pacearchaeota archaeon]
MSFIPLISAGFSDFIKNIFIGDIDESSIQSTVTGKATYNPEAISLGEIHLGESLNKKIKIIDGNDLPNILAQGTFTDNQENSCTYDSTIKISSNSKLEFSDSDKDLEDPEILVQLSSEPQIPVYTWVIDFLEPVDFTEAKGKELIIFGNSYIVDESTDSNVLFLINSESDIIELEEGNEISINSNQVSGTLVTLESSFGFTDVTKIEIAVAAEDNNDYILENNHYTDPIFGTISIDFIDLKNKPSLENGKDVWSGIRKGLSITKEGNRELGLEFEIPGADLKVIPFIYQEELADDDNYKIHIVEGENLDDDEYFILNSGNYQHYMVMTKVMLSESSGSDVHFKDVIIGNSYNDMVDNNNDINETPGTTTAFTLDNQDYTVESVDSDTVKIYSSDYCKTGEGCYIDVYPIIELIDGKHKFAFIDDVTIKDVKSGTTLNLPTGTLTITETTSSQKIGSVYYDISLSSSGESTYDVMIGVSSDLKSSSKEENPGILFLEDEESDGDENAILLPVTDDGTYSSCKTPSFSGEYDTGFFESTDSTGYLTSFGSYILEDASDSNQILTSITYAEEQIYAEIYISEGVGDRECKESWTCTSWSDCIDDKKTRTCSDVNNCGTTKNKPATMQRCGNCTSNWFCTNWSSCINNEQKRACTDINTCGFSENKPIEIRNCTSEDIQISDNVSIVYIKDKEVSVERNTNGVNIISVQGRNIKTYLEIIEESDKVYIITSEGNKEIKILPCEAIFKAKK